MRTELDMLMNTPLFRGLDQVAREAADLGEWQAFPKGSIVFDPDRFFPALGMVTAGSLEVTRGSMRMDGLGLGDLFGAASLFNRKGRYPTTIIAAEDSRVLFIRRERIEELLVRYPELSLRYITYLSERLSFMSDRLDALSAGRGAEKLLCFLRDKGGRVEGLPGEKLAATLGLSRATLYRAMDALMERGLLVRKGRALILNEETGRGGRKEDMR